VEKGEGEREEGGIAPAPPNAPVKIAKFLVGGGVREKKKKGRKGEKKGKETSRITSLRLFATIHLHIKKGKKRKKGGKKRLKEGEQPTSS